MKSFHLALATAAMAIMTTGMIGAPSAEAFTVYTSRTAWQNALGGAPIITDPFSNERSNAPTITFDSGVTSTGNGTVPTPVGNAIFIGRYFGAVEGQGDASNFFFDTITWSFPQPIFGFGADWFETADGDFLTVTGNFDGSGDQTVNFFDVLGSPGTGFLGIIGTTPFSAITFGTQGASFLIGNEFFSADDLAYAEIPTPALLPGLVGMGLAAWRKRQTERNSTQA
jgi:hypothetical protein